MKIVLSQRTANRLMKLYREMDLVPRKNFDQNDCNACVIGHAMRHGIMNGYTNTDTFASEEFNDAVKWIGLPIISEDTTGNGRFSSYSIHADFSNYEFGLLGDYLFGNDYGVHMAAETLGGLPNKCKTPADAKKRIETVLKMAGYEVVWDE